MRCISVLVCFFLNFVFLTENEAWRTHRPLAEPSLTPVEERLPSPLTDPSHGAAIDEPLSQKRSDPALPVPPMRKQP